MNIICFDIDDSLLPYVPGGYDTRYFGLNFRFLVNTAKKTNSFLYMISSWSSMYNLENNKLVLKNPEDNDILIENITNIINKYSEEKLIGLSKQPNRRQEIINLLNQGHKVIAIDDMNLNDITHPNYLFIKTIGKLDNERIKKIEEFFSK